MGVNFRLSHTIDLQHHAGWLWYSHDEWNPPRDRQVVSSQYIPKPPGIGHMAYWYFLTDAALQLLAGSRYYLKSIKYGEWDLWIEDPGRAALFKLRFM